MTETLTNFAERTGAFTRDAFYVTVGTGVLVVQRAQVRRRELTAAVRRGAEATYERVRSFVS
jgi:hypothetical protein